MHFDFFHAIVSALLIWAIYWIMRRAGILDPENRRWDWKFFGAIFVVILILNLIWPVA